MSEEENSTMFEEELRSSRDLFSSTKAMQFVIHAGKEYMEAAYQAGVEAERQRAINEVEEAKKAWLERWDNNKLPKDTLSHRDVVVTFFNMAIEDISKPR